MTPVKTIEQFRRRAGVKEIEAHSDAQYAYNAFQLSAEEKRYLEIRPAVPLPSECLPYAMLGNIRLEWRFSTGITLMFGNFMQVIIDGRNLGGLAEALRDWKVIWLQEFDAKWFEVPKDQTAPFIEKITVHTQPPEKAPSVERLH